jgi:hypothetical protein
VSTRPTPAARLADADAILTRSDVAALGWPRRGVDAIFRGCPVYVLEGYARPAIRVEDYLAFLERSRFDGDRVR